MQTVIDGFLRWEMINRAGEVVQQGHQHNLLTDAGMNIFATRDFTYNFIQLAVGDGNRPPAVTDTALVSEVGRVQGNVLSFYGAAHRVADGVYRASNVVEFDYSQGNGNLQEWGLFGLFTTEVATVRELFRDGNGAPVVLTKTNAVKLRLTYTVQLSIGPVIPQPFSINIPGLGQKTGTFCWVDGNRAADQITGIIDGMFSGSGNMQASVTAENVQLAHETMIGGFGGLRPVPLTPKPYVVGSYRRAYKTNMDTQDGNGVIRFIGTRGQYWMEGFVIRFDDGQEISKDDLHKLNIDELFSVSWSRGDAPVPS